MFFHSYGSASLEDCPLRTVARAFFACVLAIPYVHALLRATRHSAEVHQQAGGLCNLLQQAHHAWLPGECYPGHRIASSAHWYYGGRVLCVHAHTHTHTHTHTAQHSTASCLCCTTRLFRLQSSLPDPLFYVCPASNAGTPRLQSKRSICVSFPGILLPPTLAAADACCCCPAAATISVALITPAAHSLAFMHTIAACLHIYCVCAARGDSAHARM